MAYALGQMITDVISIRDETNAPVLLLEEDDFSTLEAYLLTSPASTELVALNEINEGQYSVQFTPGIEGIWVLHYVYDVNPVFIEQTRTYDVTSSSTVVTVSGGGTWTYEGDLDDPLQEVRFLIQDTDSTYPLFTDNEVSYALGGANNNVRRAAISLVERLLVRYSKMADTTELDLSVRASQLYENAERLLIQLKSGGSSGVPYAGGISIADINVNLANTDRVVSTFDRNRRWPEYGGIVRPG